LNRILILTEAGKNIGFGHLTRCTAIYNYLEDSSFEVDLIVNLNEALTPNLGFENIDWLNINPEFFANKYNLIIIDSYLVSKSWLLGLKNKQTVVVHIDDYNRIIYPVNLIINPNIFLESLDYSNQTAKYIGGPDYLILRKPFRLKKEKSIYNGKPRLLITLGGSDYRNLLPKLINWSTDLNLFKISIIAPDGIEILSKGVRVLPLLDANSMANEIINSEVIISACGQTLHEIASINRSTIGIGIDIDQIPNHKFYNSINFIKHNLWWDQNELEEEVKKELIRLADSSNREKDLKIDFKVNKDGAKNVVNEIIKLL
jgi:spore coat polysaccharide biosynthesis predicted glycosyltransferase SpsG